MTGRKATNPEISRRSVIGIAGGALAVAATGLKAQEGIAQPRHPPPPAGSAIVMMDAIPLAAAIRARQFSCVEVMTAYLDHIDRQNPGVNAIVALQPREALLAQAA